MTCAIAASAYAQSITFDREAAGIPPSDFDSWGTGEEGPGLWAVVSDDSVKGGHAFEQYRHEPAEHRVALAIYKPFSGINLEVELGFKTVSGRLDQTAGVALRLTTPDDYYVARASALTQDVRLYRVLKGDWGLLASANAPVAPKQWHTLVLKAEGDHFLVKLNGQPLFTATDATFGTPGKIALWTKADSVTRFDHLHITPLP